MVLHFRTRDTGIACGDVDATLTGVTLAGQLIQGTGAIKTTGCNKSSPAVDLGHDGVSASEPAQLAPIEAPRLVPDRPAAGERRKIAQRKDR